MILTFKRYVCFSRNSPSHATQGQGNLYIMQHHSPEPPKCQALCSSQSRNINPHHSYKIVTVHNFSLIFVSEKHFSPGCMFAVPLHRVMKPSGWHMILAVSPNGRTDPHLIVAPAPLSPWPYDQRQPFAKPSCFRGVSISTLGTKQNQLSSS